jgi:hypothetical protein
MPITTLDTWKLALRLCLFGAQTHQSHAEALLHDVLRIGKYLTRELHG